MTYKEAIETLTLIKMDSFNFDDDTIGIKEGEQAIDMAIEVLQKRVPMKPCIREKIHEFDEKVKIKLKIEHCPSCGKPLDNIKKEKICECDQRIDWSDTE